jgi:hypothetical protein
MGITASLVANPIRTKIEQKNSEKAARKSDAPTPMPSGSANFRSPPAKYLVTFEYPCFSMNNATTIRKIKSMRSTAEGLKDVWKTDFII